MHSKGLWEEDLDLPGDWPWGHTEEVPQGGLPWATGRSTTRLGAGRPENNASIEHIFKIYLYLLNT